jgi:hypothetical protein
MQQHAFRQCVRGNLRALIVTLAALVLMSVELPAGETHLKRPMEIPKSAHAAVRGNPRGSTLILDADFKGSAAIVADGASDLIIEGFTIRGNRTDLKSDWYLPPGETPFADYFSDNGIVVRNSSGVAIRNVTMTGIRAFPVIVSASSDVMIDGVRIKDSGTLNRAGRNNTSGGILLEQGVARFEVLRCSVSRITGNAIWTHSYSSSPRSSDGSIHDNTISRVARDAIQVGHATKVRVENNTGSELGYPAEYVDVESQAVAVALDTSGNVDLSLYAGNRFTDVNGQCIDLDGFHDGSVLDNTCLDRKPLEDYPWLHAGIVFGNNNPSVESANVIVKGNDIEGFAYGGVFLIGLGNRIEDNRFTDMNRAHCGIIPVPARCAYALDQPDMLRAGVSLANNGGRPAVTKRNVIRGTTMTGFGMKEHCVAAAPGVSLAENIIEANRCGP